MPLDTLTSVIDAADDEEIPSIQRRVEIDGVELEDEIDAQLELVTVLDRLAMPDTFTLVFRDPDRDVLERAGVKVGAKVGVFATSPGGDEEKELVWGEVTSIEPDYTIIGSRAMVRGYDLLHRLAAGRQTRTFQNMTFSDIVGDVAGEAGLEAETEASGAVIEHVIQANQSNLDFLYSLARRVGFDLTIEHETLHFTTPTPAAEAPPPGDEDSTDPRQLVWNERLLEFRGRMSAAGQVSDVSVRGWSVNDKKAVIGRALATASNASISMDPFDLATSVGGESLVVVDRPVGDQGAADDLAATIAEQIGSGAFEATAVAVGSPELQAGVAVSIADVDPALAGAWVISSARHEFGTGAYRTHLEFCGRHDRSLHGLVANGGSSGADRRIPNVVIGIVTNNEDPQSLGRVKVSYPWMADDAESHWARLATIGAGKEHGLVWIPEVGDEVVVAFEHGDIRFPIVVGSLWNGVDKPPQKMMPGLFDKGKVKRSAVVSRTGHVLMFYDNPEDAGIILATNDAKVRIVLSQDESTNNITIYTDGDIAIQADGDLRLKAGGAVKVEAGSTMDLKASGNASLSGAKVAIN